jgi:hypothetical protein
MKFLRIIWLVCISLFYGIVSSSAGPEKVGHIMGTISDSSGSPVAYANVVVVGTNFGAMSLTDGSYLIGPIPRGEYSIIVRSMDGRMPGEIPVIVSPGDTIIINVTALEVYPQPQPATAITDVIPQRVIDRISSAEIVEYGLLCSDWDPRCNTLPEDCYPLQHNIRKYGGRLGGEDVAELKSILLDPASYRIYERPLGSNLCRFRQHMVYWFYKDWGLSKRYHKVFVVVSVSCSTILVKGAHSEICIDVGYAQDRLLELMMRLCPDDSLSKEGYRLRHGRAGPSN